MDAPLTLSVIFGAFIGAGVMYFFLWHHARKVEALVPGGLKTWDEYDGKADHASPTGRTVTQ